jgi:hypothetical protein
MAVYSKTLYELRQSVAMSLDDLYVCQVDANATNATCANATLLKSDDFFNGWDIRFYLGTHKDITREVTDFDNATNTVTFAPVLASNTDTTDYFELHKIYSTRQYNDAINRAIEMFKDEYLLDIKDETTTFSTNTYEYSVPSGFRYISQIYYEDITDANTFYTKNLIDDRLWWIVGGSTPLIKFNDRFGIGSELNGKKMRIIGQQIQSDLTNDANTCALPPEFIIEQARAILLRQKDDLNDSAVLAQLQADRERKRYKIPAQGKSVFED